MHCLLPPAHCLLATGYCLLLTAFCLVARPAETAPVGYQIKTKDAGGTEQPRLTIETDLATVNAYFEASNVGVGIAAPQGPFQVQLPAWTSRDTDSQHVIINNSADNNYGIRFGFTSTGGYGVIDVLNPGVAWGNLILQDDPASGGSVGIGTTVPGTKLHVETTANPARLRVRNPDAAGDKKAQLELLGDTDPVGGSDLGKGAVLRYDGSSNNIELRGIAITSVADEPLGIAIERITGNVAVGAAASGSGPRLSVLSAASGTVQIGAASGGIDITSIAGESLRLGANGTEYLTILGSGNPGYVGIGNTNPGAMLTVNGVTRTNYLTVGSDTALNSGQLYITSSSDIQNIWKQTSNGADQKTLRLIQVAADNKSKFEAINDAFTAATYTFITMDHSSGNVGIGAASPGSRLDVGGTSLTDQIQNRATWGLNARVQGLIVMPEGTVTDDGAGNLTFGSTVIVMDPLSGSWIRVAAGTYALGAWGALYVDIPPTGTRGTTATPTVTGWADTDRLYDGRDRVVLAQRQGAGAIYTRFGLPANISGGSVSGSGTANYVAKFTGAGTIGNSTIRDDGTNVGVGVAPGTKLDVAGTIRGGNADTNIGNHATYGTSYSGFWRQGADYSLLTDGTNTFLNAPVSSGNIYFRTANGDKMFLEGSTGNVGIGLTAPKFPLHVLSSTSASIVLEDSNASADQKKKFINTTLGDIYIGKLTDALASTVQLRITNSGVVKVYDTLYSLRNDSANNHGMIYSSTVDGPEFRGFAGFIWKTGSAGATEQMRLNATGLGIGVSPSYKLEVNGNIAVDVGGAIGFIDGGYTVTQFNEGYGIRYVGNGTHPFQVTSSSLLVGTSAGGSDYGSGNVFLGAAAPTLRIGNGSSSDGGQIEWRTGAASGRHWNIDQNGDTLRFFTERDSDDGGGAVRFSIAEDGTKSGLYVETASYGNVGYHPLDSAGVRITDEGSVVLKGGEARVDIDPVLLESMEGPYLVHATPQARAMVWVEKHPTHFVLRTDAAGDVPCDWYLSVAGKGHSHQRMDFAQPIQEKSKEGPSPAPGTGAGGR